MNNNLSEISKQLHLICKPLFEKTVIKGLQFQKIYLNGSRSVLNSNFDFLHHAFIKSTAVMKKTYTPLLINQNERYCFLETWIENITNKNMYNVYSKLYAEKQNLFGVRNQFSIWNKNQNYLENFSFWVNENTINANSFYINNLNLLEQFRLYFLDKAKSLIEASDKELIVRPWRDINSDVVHIDGTNNIFTYVRSKDYVTNDKLSLMPQKIHFKISGIDKYITKKELECALKLMQGKNNLEIANSLFVSPRTVETHLNSLRNKINVSNRQQLIDFLVQLGVNKLQ